tara:strand:+ start:478 stop:1182 length:705 start_codon:yes stop_codon:yes gene_type:complete
VNDRTILVTGSSSGIGKAIVATLLEAGAQVIGISRTKSAAFSKNTLYTDISVDIGNNVSLENELKIVLADFPRLDGLICNAGFGKFDNLENVSSEQIVSYINLNLVSHMIITRIVIPYFKKHTRGDIIFMGSESALEGKRMGSLYSAAKFGLRGFAQSVREECRNSDVRVSIVNPGLVRTPFFENLNFEPGSDSSNAIEPDDVAEVVKNIITARPGTVIDEVTMTPLRNSIKIK